MQNLDAPQNLTLIEWKSNTVDFFRGLSFCGGIDGPEFPLTAIDTIRIEYAKRINIPPRILYWGICRIGNRKYKSGFTIGGTNWFYWDTVGIPWEIESQYEGILFLDDSTIDFYRKTNLFLFYEMKAAVNKQYEIGKTPCIKETSLIEKIIKECSYIYTPNPPTAPGAVLSSVEPSANLGTTNRNSEPADAIALPPGVKIIEGENLLNDKGAVVPLTGELLSKFFSDVFPYIQEVQAKKANPERWSRPDTGTTRPAYQRNPNTLIEIGGIKYRICFCNACFGRKFIDRYAVKRETDNNSSVWFFFADNE